MSQHDYDLANQTPANFRADTNNALAAIASLNSGASEPSTTFPFMWWADTTNDQLKIRNEADSAWIVVGDLNSDFSVNVPSGSDIVQATVNHLLAAGYRTTNVDDGTKSSGTYTPSPLGGNTRRIVNGGSFTLAAPIDGNDYTMIVKVTNNASAGTITFSGFDITDGDLLTTTDGDKFLLYISVIDGDSIVTTKALQ